MRQRGKALARSECILHPALDPKATIKTEGLVDRIHMRLEPPSRSIGSLRAASFPLWPGQRCIILQRKTEHAYESMRDELGAQGYMWGMDRLQ